MASLVNRALHYVIKVGNRKKSVEFFKNVLGMKILRHEEFDKGCEATCNGPYNGQWSKTMIGYGEEDDHFVIELTYNYPKKSYVMGNDFQGYTIISNSIKEKADKNSYKYTQVNDDTIKLVSPCGYNFFIQNKADTTRKDPVIKVGLSVSNLQKSLDYWHGLLEMQVFEQHEKSALLGYSKDQCHLELVEIQAPIDHAEALGRIAFSMESSKLPPLERLMRDHKQTVLSSLISLDTPGKATVQVVILADPDGHEICFVGDKGFRDLSKVDPRGEHSLTEAMEKDSSDEWFAKKEKLKNK